MLNQVGHCAYLEIIAARNEGKVSWSVVENFTHSDIFSVVVVRTAIVLRTTPGTLHSIYFAGIGTFSAWIYLIKQYKCRWLIDSTGSCSVGKTCRLECLTRTAFHCQQPNIQRQQASVNARIHSLK